jgi:uncharacterized membrane protein YqiK
MQVLDTLTSLITAGIAVALLVVLGPVLWDRLTRKYFKAESRGAVIISGASTGIGRCFNDIFFHVLTRRER